MNRQLAVVRLWAEIDNAVRASGAPAEAAGAKTQEVIRRAFTKFEHDIRTIDDAFDRAGIYAVGFAFHDPTTEQMIFFEKGLGAQFQASQFVSPYGVERDSHSVEAFIHKTFVWTRKRQYDHFRKFGGGAPEFVRFAQHSMGINSDTHGTRVRDQYLRDVFGARYTGSDEVALGISTWLLLKQLEQEVGPDATYFPGIIRRFHATYSPQMLPLSWLGAQLELDRPTFDAVRPQLEQAWRSCTRDRRSFHQFLQRIGWRGGSDAASDLETQLALDAECYLDFVVRRFYRTDSRGSSSSLLIREILELYEENVGCPVFPYLVWALLQPETRAHLVAPIWRSFGGAPISVPEDDHSQAIQGWALTALTPIDELETQPIDAFARDAEHPSHESNGKPLVDTATEVLLTLISAVLNSLARPSVDLVYRMLDSIHYRKVLCLQAIATIMTRNVSHNLGSHVVNDALSNPKIRGDSLRLLLRYMQERMEFIAHVTGDAPYWELTESLSTIVGNFSDPKLGVLDHIIGHQLRSPPTVSFEAAGENSLVTIPHGVTGRHALYAILENMIRNAAVWTPRDRPLDFLIRLGVAKAMRSGRRYRPLEIVDNGSSTSQRVEELNILLDADIVDITGSRVARANWGLKEIRIASSFLVHNLQSLWEEQRTTTDIDPKYFLTESSSEGRCSLGLRIWMEESLGVLFISQRHLDPLQSFAAETSGVMVSRIESHLKGSANQYELIVIDAADVYGPHIPPRLLEIAGRARRLGIVGSSMPAQLENLGAVKLASDWDTFLNNIRMSDKTGKSAVTQACELWARARWPDVRLALVSEDAEALFPELFKVADKTAELLEEHDSSGLPSGANNPGELFADPRSSLLVFDHSEHAELTNIIIEELAKNRFYRPIKAPFRVGDRWRLIESSALNIGIIDERIAKQAAAPVSENGLFGTKMGRHILVRDVWRLMGVEIFEPSALADILRRDSIGGALYRLRRTHRKYDFLVVHKSLLKDWVGLFLVPGAIALSERYSGLASIVAAQRMTEELMSECTRLVLVSGSGPATWVLKSESLTGKLRQVNFAELQYSMGESEPDKTRLARLLTSL